MFIRYPWEACSCFSEGGQEDEGIWGRRKVGKGLGGEEPKEIVVIRMHEKVYEREKNKKLRTDVMCVAYLSYTEGTIWRQMFWSSDPYDISLHSSAMTPKSSVHRLCCDVLAGTGTPKSAACCI